jgi:hypothetical protein
MLNPDPSIKKIYDKFFMLAKYPRGRNSWWQNLMLQNVMLVKCHEGEMSHWQNVLLVKIVSWQIVCWRNARCQLANTKLGELHGHGNGHRRNYSSSTPLYNDRDL